MNKRTSSFLIASTSALLAIVVAFVYPPALQAQGDMPEYEVDPFWPKPLPNRWVIRQVGGVCVDAQDHVFILNRQDLVDEELDAGIQAPPVIEFDPEGTVVNSWGDPEVFGALLHDCHVDGDNNIWIIGARSGIAQKLAFSYWLNRRAKLRAQV